MWHSQPPTSTVNCGDNCSFRCAQALFLCLPHTPPSLLMALLVRHMKLQKLLHEQMLDRATDATWYSFPTNTSAPLTIATFQSGGHFYRSTFRFWTLRSSMEIVISSEFSRNTTTFCCRPKIAILVGDKKGSSSTPRTPMALKCIGDKYYFERARYIPYLPFIEHLLKWQCPKKNYPSFICNPTPTVCGTSHFSDRGEFTASVPTINTTLTVGFWVFQNPSTAVTEEIFKQAKETAHAKTATGCIGEKLYCACCLLVFVRLVCLPPALFVFSKPCKVIQHAKCKKGRQDLFFV